MVNPTAGCRVQQTCGQSKGGSSDPPSAEETAEAGRNGKSGTSAGRGSPTPKSGRRLRREWTQTTVVSAKGRSMNPMRGVQPLGAAFGPNPVRWTARTGTSPRRSSCPSLDPMRSTHGEVEKAKRPTLHDVSATTRHGFGQGCEIAFEL